MADWHYLDHAATTPARPEAVAAMVPILTDGYGNPSGAHALARAARTALDDARAQLATIVGGAAGDVVFTGGGTEADNLAVRGVVGARGGVAVCSAVEHQAVLDPVRATGGRVVPVDERGVIDLDALAAALTPEVTFVSVMLVNNEVGTIQPLAAVSELVRERAPGAVFHTDAAQALCWLDVPEHTAAADLVTVVAHKCGGPKGTAALVVRNGVALEPMLLGGGQERERRSGTQDVAGAVAFAAAATAAASGRIALTARAEAWRRELTTVVLGSVQGTVESAAPAGDRSHLVPGIVNLCLPAVDSEALLYLLEHDHRVLASAASSCASGAQAPSHVLAALGVDRRLAAGSLRLSMGWSTTDEDVTAAASGVIDAARRLQAHARDGAPA